MADQAHFSAHTMGRGYPTLETVYTVPRRAVSCLLAGAKCFSREHELQNPDFKQKWELIPPRVLCSEFGRDQTVADRENASLLQPGERKPHAPRKISVRKASLVLAENQAKRLKAETKWTKSRCTCPVSSPKQVRRE